MGNFILLTEWINQIPLTCKLRLVQEQGNLNQPCWALKQQHHEYQTAEKKISLTPESSTIWIEYIENSLNPYQCYKMFLWNLFCWHTSLRVLEASTYTGNNKRQDEGEMHTIKVGSYKTLLKSTTLNLTQPVQAVRYWTEGNDKRKSILYLVCRKHISFCRLELDQRLSHKPCLFSE